MINTLANIPFTVTGGVSGVEYPDTLSGHTCALTRFEFIANSFPAESRHISNDKFIWDLGDGTTVKGISAAHIYTIPGNYTVSLVGFSSAGQEHLSTTTKNLSVSNFFEDVLEYSTDQPFNVAFVQAGTIVQNNAVPIIINRRTSWQAEKSLSATNTPYTLQLFCSGSQSTQLDPRRHATNKWSHVDNTWSFYNAVTANNQTVEYVPTSTVETTSEKIFFRTITIWDNDQNIFKDIFDRVPLTQAYTLPGTVFVGTSGTVTTYYADDLPTKRAFIRIAQDTSKYIDRDQLIHNNILPVDKLEYFSHGLHVDIPVRVLDTYPDKIIFTSSGMVSIPLSKNKWQSTKIPFFINLATIDNSIIKSFPSLTINTSTPVTDTYVTNLSVVDTTINQQISAEFFKTIDAQLPSSLDSSYRGFFIPRDVSSNATLSGTVHIPLPARYEMETKFGWLVNPTWNKLYRITDYDTHIGSGQTGNISMTWGKSQNISLTGDTLPLATIPAADKLVTGADLHTILYVANTETDTLHRFDTLGTSISSFILSSIYAEVGSLAGNTIDLKSLATGSTTDLKTSCIAADKARNIWITCHDASIIAKINTETGNLVNYYTDSANTTIANVSGGGYLLEPSIIDTDVDSNIWVAFTQTLCSFVAKYDGTGTQAIHKSEFPTYTVPQDIAVDRNNNLWVATSNQNRQIRDTVNELVYAQTLAGGVSFYVGTVGSSSNTSLAGWQVGEIVESDWSHANRQFSGKFLITGITDIGGSDKRWKVDTLPYTGRVNQIIGAASQTTNIKVYPSDKVYKFNSVGTKLAEISGFYRPGYICPDINQNLWVCHDANNVTQIDNDTNIIGNTIVCQTDSFLDNTAPTYNLITYSEQQLGGISFNTENSISVINSYENVLFKLPLDATSQPALALSGSVTIDTAAVSGSDMYRAFGDWTGFRYINKYLYTPAAITSIDGDTTFSILPSGGKYKAGKIHENFDPSETIKSYRFQPQLLDYNTFFDDFYGQIVGTLSAEPTVLGKTVYEKIANFVSNHSDVDECSINSLYSLCKQHNVPIGDYNFDYIGGLKRIMDLTSVRHKRLWGARDVSNSDFRQESTDGLVRGRNLGSQLTNTHTVTAGIPIVAKQLFNQEFTIITPMYLSGGSADPGYDSSVGMLKTYPLSGFSSSWGWGLYSNISGLDIFKFFNFYTLVETDHIQVEGLIDWDDPYTNFKEGISGVSDWKKDIGIVDTMIDYELRRGLGLFMPSISGSNVALQ